MLYLYNHIQVPRPIFNYQVFVDGERVQKDLPPGATLPLDLAPGKHTLQVKVSFNKRKQYPLEVEAGKDYYLNTGMYFENLLNALGYNTLKIKSPEEDRMKAEPYPRPVNGWGIVYGVLSGLVAIGASLTTVMGSGQTRGTVFLFGLAMLAGSLWLFKRYPFNPWSPWCLGG